MLKKEVGILVLILSMMFAFGGGKKERQRPKADSNAATNETQTTEESTSIGSIGAMNEDKYVELTAEEYLLIKQMTDRKVSGKYTISDKTFEDEYNKTMNKKSASLGVTMDEYSNYKTSLTSAKENELIDKIAARYDEKMIEVMKVK